jgi:hypothetical protein
MTDSTDITRFNQAVTWWKNNVRKNAISNVLRMTGKGKAGSFSKVLTQTTELKLAQNIGAKTKKDFGEIFMVGFHFPRHGVFVHKGVGRGWKMVNGKVVRTATGIQKGIRIPKDWLNSEIDKSMSKLADELAGIKADVVINATRAKIN